MSYTATLTTKGQITIPKAIRNYLNLSASDKVSFVRTNNKVLVKPVTDFMSLKGSIKGKQYSDTKADKSVAQYVGEEYGKKKK